MSGLWQDIQCSVWAMAMLRARPVLQFRLRTLILTTLLVGVALGAERAWRRRQEYLNRATYHAAAEVKLSAEARALADELARFPPALLNGQCGNPRRYAKALKSVMTDLATHAAEHGRLKERYLQAAASLPWEPGPVTEPLASTPVPFPTSATATDCPSS
jgi:hypothetical protein